MTTEGLQLTKAQIQYLTGRGFSPKVISMFGTMPEKIWDKIEQAFGRVHSYRAVFLIGPESKQKELFASILLTRIALEKKKSIAMSQALTLCRADKEDVLTPGYASVWGVLGLGMVPPSFSAQKIKEFMMCVLQSPDGFLVLGTESMVVVGETYGTGFSDYLKSISFGVMIEPEDTTYLIL